MWAPEYACSLALSLSRVNVNRHDTCTWYSTLVTYSGGVSLDMKVPVRVRVRVWLWVSWTGAPEGGPEVCALECRCSNHRRLTTTAHCWPPGVVKHLHLH